MKRFVHAYKHALAMQNVVTAETQAVQHNFDKAWRFFTAHAKTEQPPWYVLLGSRQSGKTALLNHSGISFAETEQFVTRSIHAESQHCNWWFSQQGVILDVPGSYIEGENSALWHFSCQWLKKHQQRIKGIIITLNIEDLLQLAKHEIENQAQEIRNALQQLSLILKTPVPIHVMLTKADRIAGFVEFFDDLGREERAQALGIILTSATAPVLAAFQRELDALLKRLHDRVIWRLHHERNLHKRVLIHEFPLQLAVIKEKLIKSLHLFADPNLYADKFKLAGVYFTSSQQQGGPIDGLLRNLNQSFSLSSALVAYAPPVSHSYFTEVILKSILRYTPETKLKTLKIHREKSPLTLLSALAIATLGTSFYFIKCQYIPYQHAKLAIHRYQTLHTTQAFNLAQTVASLTALQQAISALQQIHAPARIDFTAHQKLLAQVQNLYQQNLTNALIPALVRNVEEQLQNQSLQDPHQLYATLTLYLSLGDTAHRHMNFVDHWLQNYWQQTQKTNPQSFLKHVHAALRLTPPPALNMALIARTRSVLNTIPYPVLAYTMLQNQHAAEVISFAQLSGITAERLQALYGSIPRHIPSVYTANLFKHIYQQEIPALEQTLANSDWVLGNTTVRSWWAKSADQLLPTIRNLYVQDYANWWVAYIHQLQLKKPLNLLQLNEQLTALSNHGMEQLWQTIVVQTQLSEFPGIQDSLHKDLPFITLANITQIQTQIDRLQATIHDITNTDNYPEVAFTYAKGRMQHADPQDPLLKIPALAMQTAPVLQNWLNTLVNNTWSTVLLTAQKYINTIWQGNVMPLYNSTIANRYPLNKVSQQDVALKDFARFFGPHGVLDDFFFSTLKPFVDTREARWQWRVRDGLALSLSNDILLQFERAGIIRKMFFDENEQMQTTFAISPINIDPAIKLISFNLDGQKMNIPGDKPSDLTWPANNNVNIAQLFYEGEQSGSLAASGPWALFRLLDNAQFKAKQDIRHFEVTFNFGGNLAELDLVAAKLINPFIPGILDQFHCPVTLLPNQ